MQLFKSGLKALLVFSLLVFTASEVAAVKPDGKPGGKPPPKDDSCTGLVAPDYVFWRDARTKGKNRMAQVAVYVAESGTDCEAWLLDIPLPEGPINDLKLTFSSVVVDGEFILGRIVWRTEIVDGAYSVWTHDFTINEGSVDGGDGPIMIMENTGEKDLLIYDLDLSPDTQSLVYRLVEYDDRPYYSISSIHKVEIEVCLLDTCEFDENPPIYSGEDTPDTYFSLRSPVFGPLGNRVYFVERWGPYSYDINAIDISSEPLVAETLVTLNLDEDPDNASYVREISSGIGYVWPGAKEYLTVSIGELHTHGCAFVYSLDVDACKTGCASTALIPMFAGIWPSWTRNGRIIHTHQGMAMKDNCTTDTVGSWDGTNLETLLKGYEPEAAGG